VTKDRTMTFTTERRAKGKDQTRENINRNFSPKMVSKKRKRKGGASSATEPSENPTGRSRGEKKIVGKKTKGEGDRRKSKR